MRALHVYSGNLFGGIERLLLTLAKCRGMMPDVEQEFALCFEGELSKQLRQSGITIRQLGAARTSRPWTVYRSRKLLQRHIQDLGIDVVICHSAWIQALFAPVAVEAGKPVMFFMHDVATGTHWIERLAKRTRPSLVVCNSEFTSQTLSRLYRDVPHCVIHCPVLQAPKSDADRAAVRRECDTDPDSTVIVQCSRLERWKGQTLHLEALALLKENASWTCWIVGGPQRPHEYRYLDELKQLAVRRGIAARVRFLGYRSDVQPLLRAADICCQPNEGPEPFGIGFIEAMYAGLPVVTVDIGASREVLGDCGVIVPPADPEELSRKLAELTFAPALRRRIGEMGRARATILCSPLTQMSKLAVAIRDATHTGSLGTQSSI